VSAYRIGISAAHARTWVERGEPPAAETDHSGPFLDVFDKLTKWIPTETLAVYIPGVTVIGANNSQPSVVFLVVMAVATPLFVLGVAFAAGSAMTRSVWISAGLATAAFAIWSLSVPMNGWQSIDAIAANQGGSAVGGAIAGILFGYLAEGITTRLNA
jgi:hypothetical protein